MSDHSRYRTENGELCIDVKLKTIEQMFDNRDPAPFRDRDLDPDLAQYLLDAGEDLFDEKSIRVVFWVEQPCSAIKVEEAVHEHFEQLVAQLRRTRRRLRGHGLVALALAVVLVFALISLSRLVAAVVPGWLGSGLKEGLVIASWIVMWRPSEILIYDWIPCRHERKVASKLFAAPIQVRSDNGPAPGSRDSVAAERVTQA